MWSKISLLVLGGLLSGCGTIGMTTAEATMVVPYNQHARWSGNSHELLAQDLSFGSLAPVVWANRSLSGA